jgi:hypothetical protein
MAEQVDIESQEPLEDELVDYDLTEEEPLNSAAVSDLVLYTLDWSVSSLIERIGSAFEITPAFQRRDAWTLQRKSLYIESLILGLPVPQIVLAEDGDRRGRFIVLDGKQRLISIKQFAAPDDEFRGFKLKNLEFATELNGMSFEDMRNSLTAQEHAENFLAQPVRTIVVRNWQDPAVLYQIFVRLNIGSVPLSPQELRQALYPNNFTRWVNERSAESIHIQRARRRDKPDFRMRDAEMLLRYIAFSESPESYRGNLRQFLDEACALGGVVWDERGKDYYESLAARCEVAIDRTFEVFEGDAFRRFEGGTYNRRFNIAVFDTMTLVLGDMTLTDGEVNAHRIELRAAFERLCLENAVFQQSLQTTTKSITSTGGRIVTLAEAVEDIVQHRLDVTDRAREMLAADH